MPGTILSARMKYTILAVIIAALGVTACGSGGTIVNKSEGGLQPIDIRSPKFFYLLHPWKEGKLATLDGWARFSEISFKGPDKIRIKHLVNFPRWKIDNMFTVWPEADLWWITSARMNHIAYLPANFKKSFIPYLTGMYNEYLPLLLDAEEGIMVFIYGRIKLGSTGRHYVFYNYKQDKVIYETPRDEDDPVIYNDFLDEGVLLGFTHEKTDVGLRANHFIYDWKTGTRTENELTKKMNELRLTVFCINMAKRFCIAEDNTTRTFIKMDWDENYENINVVPLEVLLPEGKRNMGFLLSSNGEWAFSMIRPYEGLYGERLYKRAFYHIDSRYPGGISHPVIPDNYTDVSVEWGVFVNHPVYGMCYAVEHQDEYRQYLRLYRMDDVLAEIDRQL